MVVVWVSSQRSVMLDVQELVSETFNGGPAFRARAEVCLPENQRDPAPFGRPPGVMEHGRQRRPGHSTRQIFHPAPAHALTAGLSRHARCSPSGWSPPHVSHQNGSAASSANRRAPRSASPSTRPPRCPILRHSRLAAPPVHSPLNLGRASRGGRPRHARPGRHAPLARLPGSRDTDGPTCPPRGACQGQTGPPGPRCVSPPGRTGRALR